MTTSRAKSGGKGVTEMEMASTKFPSFITNLETVLVATRWHLNSSPDYS